MHKQLSVAEAVLLLEQGAVLIDVREPSEISAGRAPQAITNTLQTFDIALVPTDCELVIVCRVGVRSNAVAQALTQAGYTAHNLAGGMNAWEAAGQPVINADGATGYIA